MEEESSSEGWREAISVKSNSEVEAKEEVEEEIKSWRDREASFAGRDALCFCSVRRKCAKSYSNLFLFFPFFTTYKFIIPIKFEYKKL